MIASILGPGCKVFKTLRSSRSSTREKGKEERQEEEQEEEEEEAEAEEEEEEEEDPRDERYVLDQSLKSRALLCISLSQACWDCSSEHTSAL